MIAMARKLPVGAEVQPGGGAHFRVWAPTAHAVAVELYANTREAIGTVPLEMESDGYFSGFVSEARPNSLYKFRLDRGSFPDPASRFQPDGPHGPSQVIEPRFRWTDDAWRGRTPREIVLYELHLGTFTAEGTWRAAAAQLTELARLGITAVEVMPVADFPGRFGWGYDGVNLFAPSRLYGSPDDARSFVDRAHELNLMVVLDVVYNHFGPDGNYVGEFSADYFTTRYKCEWGDALNFDGDNAGPVRELFISNARYWIEEFHFDGLRLDATQQIYDQSETHLLAEITAAVRDAAPQRHTFVLGENEPQHTRLVRPRESGGYGIDALWNDDFHHTAMVAATGRSEAYYSDYRGTPQEFVSACKYGYLFQGQWSRWQQQRRGTPTFGLAPRNFIAFLQNHDQVANSLHGARLHQLASPGVLRALTALTLLGPAIPLLFQGQEFAASAPFLYFADHNAELKQLIRQGRRQFLSQFRSIAAADAQSAVNEPGAVETFQRCKLDFAERAKHAPIYRLHEDLLRLRREDPTLRAIHHLDGAVLGAGAFVLRFFPEHGDDRLLVVNLGVEQRFDPAPEPLLAPLEKKGWRILWSSESLRYGGNGTPLLETAVNWMIPGQSAVVLGPDENCELTRPKISEKD
jgi:maltooligosyltrehalose trehalohydrolase